MNYILAGSVSYINVTVAVCSLIAQADSELQFCYLN